MNIRWDAVADHLYHEGLALRRNAESSFPDDLVVKREMNTRASIFITLAAAINKGIGRV